MTSSAPKRRLLLLLLPLLLLPQLSIHAAQRETPVVKAVAHARRAVVNIRTEQIRQRSSSPFGFGDSFFDQFFRELLPPAKMTSQSLGSGVIIDAEGHLLTSAHVIARASRIFVALPDHGDEIEARLVGVDRRLDLAILQVTGEGPWPFLAPGRSDDLMLGETVIAIGNPLGLGHSITTGVVSSVARQIQLEEGVSSRFIQSDALINPGNSGGPLININGELIGINTAIARQAQGIGFSTPIDTAKRVLGELVAHGEIRPAYLGLLPAEVSDSFVSRSGRSGVLLVDFLTDSPAKQAGLQVADILLALNGFPLSRVDDLNNQIASYPPGSQVSLQVLRGLKRLVFEVELAPLSDQYLLAYTRRTFGLGLRNDPRGLVVASVEADSAAARAGIEPGDLVAEVARRKVADLDDLRRLIAALMGREPLSFLVVRDNRGYLLPLP